MKINGCLEQQKNVLPNVQLVVVLHEVNEIFKTVFFNQQDISLCSHVCYKQKQLLAGGKKDFAIMLFLLLVSASSSLT